MSRKHGYFVAITLLIGAAGFALTLDHMVCPQSNCSEIRGAWDVSSAPSGKLLVFPTPEGLTVAPAQ